MLILVEKPHRARTLDPHLQQRFPGQPLHYLFVNPYGSPFKFDYPRNLSWADYPLHQAAQYKLDTERQNQFTQGEFSRCNYDELPMNQGALAFVETMPSTVAAANRLRILLEGKGVITNWAGMFGLITLDSPSIEKALLQPMSEDVVQDACKSAELKADFDFSFLINAAGLLTKSYRAAGGITDSPQFSKFTVQVLYAMRTLGVCSESDAIQHLWKWKGTGRYTEARASLGSTLSRHTILTNLLEYGLLDRTGEALIQVSPLGHAFLGLMHPDCEDPDLPFRLAAWQETPDTSAAPASRYLQTWFGKQKRFMSRTA